MKVTKHLEEFTVFERTVSQFQLDNPNIMVVQGVVESIDTSRKAVILTGTF